jgi:hypothetical protein
MPSKEFRRGGGKAPELTAAPQAALELLAVEAV